MALVCCQIFVSMINLQNGSELAVQVSNYQLLKGESISQSQLDI